MTTIYFATNRLYSPSGNSFGSTFSNDGLANLRFGRAEVTGANFDQFNLEVAPENLLTTRPMLGSQIIFEQVRQQMQQNAEDTLIFIHGYNVSFEGALSSAAQLHNVLMTNDVANPLKLNMCVFSWPSDGRLILTNPRSRNAVSYWNDRLDAKASGPAFARGLLKVADFINSTTLDNRCSHRLHLIGHSMGIYVLRHALWEIKNFVAERIPRIFDQILMMAADEDDDAFDLDYKLQLIPRLTRRTSVYFNRGDLGLWASNSIKGNSPRLGSDGPLNPRQLPRNVYPIDCTDVVSSVTEPSEHGYFVKVPRVVTDMVHVLWNEIPDEIPGRRYIPETNRYRLLRDLSPQNR